jgi:hypothetical protein
MSFLQSITPINLQQEKEKFFADQTYNPQFRYAGEVDQKKLVRYGFTQVKTLEIAEHILNKAYFNRTEKDLVKLDGAQVELHEVEKKTRAFLKMHGLENRYEIKWSATYVARASIDATLLRLKSTAEYRTENVLGMLYHEVGTHALRRVNYEQQPWFKKKKKFGFSDYLRTEEGLAGLHSLLPKTNKLAYTSAIRYVAVEQAQKGSFVELWQFLTKYIDDPETRWMVTVKEKRGLENTSFPGGYTKDIVYFEGLLECWEWLNSHNFDLTPLYFGKLAKEDVPKAIELNPNFTPQLPSFYALNPDEYKQHLFEIGTVNDF